MKITKTIFFSLLLSLFLIMPSSVLAGTMVIGDICEQDSDCLTQKCLESNLTTPKNKFCVCDTAEHCETRYSKIEATEIWTCDKTLAPKSNNLPFCQSDKQGIKAPISAEVLAAAATPPTTVAGVVGSLLTPADGELITLDPPKTSINIPGLAEWEKIEVVSGATAQIPYIALYVVGIYKYALVIGSILATMMLMIGGIMYMSSVGVAERISTAKNIIFGAISGIILLLGSYLILATINPNLIHLSSIQLETVKPGFLDGPTPGDMSDWGGTVPELPEGDVPTGMCLGNTATTKLYGDAARQAAIAFAQFAFKSGKVSYAFGGYGAPCAQPIAGERYEAACQNTPSGQGRFQCSSYMSAKLKESPDSTSTPWELEYCTDCSGFTDTIYRCGAKQKAARGTSSLFGCTPDLLARFQPIPRSETKPGDMVGYLKVHKILGAGHVMTCLNNGCTSIIHVHGPQAYKKSYIGQAISVDDNSYLIKLEDEKKKKLKTVYPNFKFEYRRNMGVEEGWSTAMKPSCENVSKHSLCTAKPGINCQ